VVSKVNHITQNSAHAGGGFYEFVFSQSVPIQPL